MTAALGESKGTSASFSLFYFFLQVFSFFFFLFNSDINVVLSI